MDLKLCTRHTQKKNRTLINYFILRFTDDRYFVFYGPQWRFSNLLYAFCLTLSYFF